MVDRRLLGGLSEIVDPLSCVWMRTDWIIGGDGFVSDGYKLSGWKSPKTILHGGPSEKWMFFMPSDTSVTGRVP